MLRDPLRPLVRPIMSVLLDDPRMAAALGLRPAPRLLGPIVHQVLRLRGRLAPRPTSDAR